MKYIFCLFVFSLLFVECGCTTRNDPTVVKANEATLAGSGEAVGTLPDGRKVVRYRIEMGDSHDHWLYVTDGSITINRSQSNGKTTSNHVDVIIDGVKYTPDSAAK